MRKKYPTQERLKELFDYRDDGQLIRKTNESQTKVGEIAGSINKISGYRQIWIGKNLYYSHRLLWVFHNGYNSEYQIDHINRNRSDNRIKNLREVTQSCNNRNTGNHKTNISGVKGVYFSRDNSWDSYIKINGKKYHLGCNGLDFDEAVLLRLSAEQCLNWEGCDSSSPAYKYAIKHNLIKR